MTILDRLLRREPKDPLWDSFINRPPADPANEISTAIRTAPTGDSFPVVSEVPEPRRMASDLSDLAIFLGALALGVTGTNTAHLELSESQEDPEELVARLPVTLICQVKAEHDPDKTMGIGGQHARRESAMVNHSLMAYIHELGYQAQVCRADADRVLAAAGLKKRPKTFVGDVVLTDLPVATGTPEA